MFTRKLVISFWLLVISLLFTPFTTFAQNAATPSATLPSVISPTSPAYTDLFVHNMFHTFSCLTIGASIIGQPCATYQLQKNAQGTLQSVPVLAQVDTSGGLMGTMTSLVTTLFTNRPVRTIDYLASVEGLGIIKEAHAQVVGSGNAVLSPIISLWQVSRNISYLIMIIIFIVIGLMVMFRQRINPQTVITAQAALPGLVIGLVMITFSYFLAGLVVDLSFIGIDLVGYYFQSAQQTTSNQQLSQALQRKNVLSLLSPMITAFKREDINAALDVVWDQVRGRSGAGFGLPGINAETIIRGFVGAASYQFGASVGPALGIFGGGSLCIILGGIIGLAALPVAAPAIPLCAKIGEAIGTFALPGLFAAAGYGNPPFIISFVIVTATIFIMLYIMGKLFLRLLNVYLSIIFYTITAPFHFLIASLPGRQGVATNWLRGLLGNVLAFPAVAAGIYFAAYLLGPQVAPLPGNQSQLDVFGLGATLPLLGGLDLSFLRVLLAFGTFAALPAIPDVINKSIGVQGGGIMGLFGQEIQSNIGAGRGQQTQFARGIGAVGTDVASYKKKWYENPFEERGIGSKLGQMVENTAPTIPPFRRTLGQSWKTLFSGKSPQERNRPNINPANERNQE